MQRNKLKIEYCEHKTTAHIPRLFIPPNSQFLISIKKKQRKTRETQKDDVKKKFLKHQFDLNETPQNLKSDVKRKKC